jgi:predicted nuclease with TOPRIM domain
MAKGESPEGSGRPASGTTLLRSLSEGVRTVVTVTERLNDLRTEIVALRSDLHRLAESVYRIAGRLDGIEQRFTEVDKRIEVTIKLAVRDEFDRRISDRGPPASAE